MADAQTESVPSDKPPEPPRPALPPATRYPVPDWLGTLSLPLHEKLSTALTPGLPVPLAIETRVYLEASLGSSHLVVRCQEERGLWYGLSILDALLRTPVEAPATRILIVVPTRDRAIGVATLLRKISEPVGHEVLAIFGGASLGRQTQGLKAGTPIVVGTPGRLLDHHRRGNLVCSALTHVIVDGADDLFALGFGEEVTALMKERPDAARAWLLASTLSQAVATLADGLGPEVAWLGEPEPAWVPGVSHTLTEIAEGSAGPEEVEAALERTWPVRAAVLCPNQGVVDELSERLRRWGFPVAQVSGPLRMRERRELLATVGTDRPGIVVATDALVPLLPELRCALLINVGALARPALYVERQSRMSEGSIVSLLPESLAVTFRQHLARLGCELASQPQEPAHTVVQPRSQRIMKELTERAAGEDLTEHLPIAEQILSDANGKAMVAMLLKSFYAPPPPTQEARPNRSNGEQPRGDGDRDRRPRRRGRGGGRGRGERELGPNRDSYERQDVVPAEQMLMGSAAAPPTSAPLLINPEEAADGLTRLRVNIGFLDGFKGRGSVAKKIAQLAGLNEGTLEEVDLRKDHSLLKASADIAELIVDRVDGAQIGKKVLTVEAASLPS